MSILRYSAVALAVLSLMAVSTPAGASPTGTTYTVQVNNFGGCTAGVAAACETGQTLTWDGVAEAVPGTALTVNEADTQDPTILPNVAGFTYQAVAANFGTALNVGVPSVGYDLLEMWVDDATVGGFSGAGGIPNPAAFSGITATDINNPLSNPMEIYKSLAGTGFVYFTNDGVVFNIQDALLQGLPIGGHPFNPAITYGVLYTGSPTVGKLWPDIAVDSEAFNVPWSVLEFALGMQGQGINDVHVGVLVETILPEPGSALLLGMGLIGIAAIRRRA
ncbi:MAG: PEP-CTERM sorting domain-containing protein [bacterium]|nr:PEP-CTERM sorting domain-containing protein [bacterium]